MTLTALDYSFSRQISRQVSLNNTVVLICLPDFHETWQYVSRTKFTFHTTRISGLPLLPHMWSGHRPYCDCGLNCKTEKPGLPCFEKSVILVKRWPILVTIGKVRDMHWLFLAFFLSRRRPSARGKGVDVWVSTSSDDVMKSYLM